MRSPTHLREDVRLEPQDALAWQRLGLTLLFALHETAGGARAPSSRPCGSLPATPRRASGWRRRWPRPARPVEAKAAFEAALRLDPRVLDGRPAARAAFEAARGGASWP